jgi:signal transduction histidine kinase
MTRRVFALLIGLTTLGVVVLFVPAVLAVRKTASEAQEVTLVAFASDAGRLYEDTGQLKSDDEHVVGVYSPDQVLIAGEGPEPPDRAVVGAYAGEAVHDDGEAVMVVGIPVAGGEVLRVEESSASWRERANAAVLRLAGVALLVIAGAVGAAFYLSRRLSRPLVALADSARRLGEGDFTVRAHASGLPELDAVSDTLNHTADQLGRLVDRERRLTADLAHQLRTPVAGMRLAIEAEFESPREDREEILRELHDAVDRMDAVSASLITLYRDGRSRGGRVDVVERVGAASARWATQVGAAGRCIDTVVGEPTFTDVKAGAIDATLDVLIDNALVHGVGTIVVSTWSDEHGVHLAVEDEGSFLPDESGHRDELHGVGLSLADAVMSAEGASMHLASASPTRFEVSLPRVD